MNGPSTSPSISVSCEIIGSGHDGSDPCFVVSVEKRSVYSCDVNVLQRYLFNSGEGIQRMCAESKLKLNSVKKLFVTRMDIQSCSGIPGLILALASSGSATLDIVSPCGMESYLKGVNEYVHRKYPIINVVESKRAATKEETLNCIDDEHLEVHVISLQKNTPKLSWKDHCVFCNKENVSREDFLRAKDYSLKNKKESNKQQSVSIEDLKQDIKKEKLPCQLIGSEYRRWLVDFYSKYEPNKLVYVDQILKKFMGKEEDLFRNLFLKYIPTTDCNQNFTLEEFLRFNVKHNPKEVQKTKCDQECLIVDKTLKEDNSDEDKDQTVLDKIVKAGKDKNLFEKEMQRTKSDQEFVTIEKPVNIDHYEEDKYHAVINKEVKIAHGRNSSGKGDNKHEGIISFDNALADDTAFTVDIAWLKKFYTVYDSSKLPYLEQIQRRFAGRECYFKKMLEEKYNITFNGALCCNNEKQSLKRPRIQSDEEKNDEKVRKVEYVRIIKNLNDDLIEETIELKDEAIINCYLIRSKHEPSCQFAVVDCQSLSWLNYLISHPSFHPCKIHPFQVMFHMTKPSLVYTTQYSNWIKSFGTHTQHVLFDGSVLDQRKLLSNINLYTSFSTLVELNTLDHDFFPIPFPWKKSLQSYIDNEKKALSTAIIVQVNDLQFFIATFQLRFHLSSSSFEYFTRSKQTMLMPLINENQMKIKKRNSSVLQRHLSQNGFYPELVFLGTGSAAPSKHRNSSSIYLKLSTHSCGILIDAGEGCYGQLYRKYGDQTQEIIGGLLCVWISHKHADHHSGLSRILVEYNLFHQQKQQKRSRTGDYSYAPLLIIASTSVQRNLEYVIASCFNKEDIKVELVTPLGFNDTSSHLRHKFFSNYSPLLHDLHSIPVNHCYDAYGLLLVLSNGMRIVYSGDTRPCLSLVQVGYRPFLLIHEATFTDDKKTDAVKKKHSTISEAIGCGLDMEASFIILTHFSQRYPSIPHIESTLPSNVTLACDLMSITLREDFLNRSAAISRTIIKKNLERSEDDQS